jgi:hypothetical protein
MQQQPGCFRLSPNRACYLLFYNSSNAIFSAAYVMFWPDPALLAERRRRKAAIGSIREARVAGMLTAIPAMNSIAVAEMSNVKGSGCASAGAAEEQRRKPEFRRSS